MDRFDGNQDDLFEGSTMTFREHLEELRKCLMRAAIWLGVGVAIGLVAASSVVAYVKKPLEKAIYDYNAYRGLALMGFEDPKSEELNPLHAVMADNAFVVEQVHALPADMADAFGEMRRKIDSGEPVETTEQDGAGESDDPEKAKPNPIIAALAKLAATPPQYQLRRVETNVSSFEMTESFMIWFKAALVVGAVISAPGVFYNLWSFVAAGLHTHERKYVKIYLPVSTILFVAGVLMAFFVVLEYVITFLLQFNESMDVSFEPRLNYYVSFVLMLPLGFGIAFQLPLVMLFLQRIGLLETEAYTSSWRIAVVVIFVISMLVTPADWTSMILLAIPLCFLYLLGIAMCKFLPRGRGMGSAAYDPS